MVRVMLLRRHTTRNAEYGDLFGSRRSRRGRGFKNQQTEESLSKPTRYLRPNIEVVSPKAELGAELSDHLIDWPPLAGSNRTDIRMRRRANKNRAAKEPRIIRALERLDLIPARLASFHQILLSSAGW